MCFSLYLQNVWQKCRYVQLDCIAALQNNTCLVWEIIRVNYHNISSRDFSHHPIFASCWLRSSHNLLYHYQDIYLDCIQGVYKVSFLIYYFHTFTLLAMHTLCFDHDWPCLKCHGSWHNATYVLHFTQVKTKKITYYGLCRSLSFISLPPLFTH